MPCWSPGKLPGVPPGIGLPSRCIPVKNGYIVSPFEAPDIMGLVPIQPFGAGALVLARVARVVYGCADPKGGAVKTLFEIGSDVRLNHRFEVISGVLTEQCASRLQRFFAALRAQ